MSEQQIQAKIIKWLQSQGFYVFKVVVANRKGILDINGCTPWGQFFAIEVKMGNNKPSKLQHWNVKEIRKVGGIAMVAYSLNEVKANLELMERKHPE